MQNIFLRKTALLILLLAAGLANPLGAADVSVNVLNNSFSPSSVQINVGDSVTWMNQEDFPHTSTRTGVWDGLMPGEGDTFSRIFNAAGTFSYFDKSSSATGEIIVVAPNTPPSITITNPLDGASFAAPATILIQASASDPDGSVARVTFFVGATAIRTNTTAPYSATASNLIAGVYILSAVATDDLGAKTTNSVNITVTNPAIILSTVKLSGGQFQFNVSGLTVGKTNYILGSTNLTNWLSLRTNVATVSTSSFAEPPGFNRRFYRVRQLP